MLGVFSGSLNTINVENPLQLHGNFSRKGSNGNPSRHEKWLSDFQQLVKRAERKSFVKHNITKYGRLPIWVAIEIFDFGTMSKLFSGMKHQDKLAIEKMLGLYTGNDFETWLRGFNFIRNTAAHHARLWNCNILEHANVPRTKINLYNLPKSRPFLYFCLMQSVMKVICPQSQWGQQFIELIDNFPDIKNRAVKIEDMGIVDNWKSWQLWQLWQLWT
jgi:abortive infection bacteriophage resistance protein